MTERPSPVRARRKRIVITWALSALVAVAGALAVWSLVIRSDSDTPASPAEEWVRAGTVEEIEERYVVYLEEHEVFVLTMATVPEKFVALSAWSPAAEDDGERRRMLFCTLSNVFENEHGDFYDRAGHPHDGDRGGSMSRVALRVTDGVVEIAPSRVTENDLDRFGGPHGPPCGEWGVVEEGPPGFALATEAPAGETRTSIEPSLLTPGQRAELHIDAGRNTSGLRWDLYEREDSGLWHWRGILVAGPRYESYFDLAPLDPGGGIDDIGFGGSYSMDIEIPKLDPGTYRLATSSITDGPGELHERYVWHYTDFEVIAD